MEKCPRTSSCFLSPDTPGDRTISLKARPRQWSPSSTFLTPPSSQEKPPRHDFCLEIDDIPKLDYSIGDDKQPKESEKLQRSPLHPADRIIGTLYLKNVDKIDFVCELLLMNCDRICSKICDLLAGDDLRRFAAVSKTWRMFVMRESHIQRRWKAHLKECRYHCSLKGKENMGLAKGLTPTSSPPRVPLSSLNHNKRESSTEVTQRQHIPVIPSSVDLRPCPKCTSPSQTQTEQCCCQKCGLLFCSKCLRQMDSHDSTKCQGLPLLQSQSKRSWQSRRNGADIVGSKKSKERIRRL